MKWSSCRPRLFLDLFSRKESLFGAKGPIRLLGFPYVTLMIPDSPNPVRDMPLEKIRLLHAGHSSAQPDIWLVYYRGRSCVLRDYSKPRPWIFRRLCRWAVRREIRVYRMLEGVRGIPQLIEPLDPDRYLMEYIEGGPLSNRTKKNPPSEEFLNALQRTLQEMHSRGVAHGDFRNKNILIDREEKPHIVDFSTAWWGTSLWRKPLFAFYRNLDDRRFVKSKAKFAPHALTEEEKRLAEGDPWYLKVGAFYRKGLYQRIRSRRNESAED